MTGDYFKTFTRYSGLVGIVGVWLLFVIGMVRTHLLLLDTRPLSYLGVSSFAPYFKLGLIGGIFLMAAFYSYLQRTFAPAQAFRAIFFVGLVMQGVAATTPYKSHNMFQWLHWTAAIILATALVCSPWLFASSKNISASARRISRGVTITYLVALVIEAVLLLTLKYYVISELINLLIFHMWILYLTFIPD
jgi:hypothetical protein